MGPRGSDGELRLYGDGSSGALTISEATTWLGSYPRDNDLLFTDFTLEAGRLLFVPSGTVIRCTRRCRIDGTLTVYHAAKGGFVEFGSAASSLPRMSPANPGISLGTAGHGEVHFGSGAVAGGLAGIGADLNAWLFQTKLGPPGGGGGGAGGSPLDGSAGGPGGGTITIVAREAVEVGGLIEALGYPPLAAATGGGGGGGGLVLLGSSGRVTVTGIIDARGGNGGASSATSGPGGGGGGGLIHVVAPQTNLSGGLFHAGGLAGTQGAAGSVSAAARIGGGGGGGGVGNGGRGGGVSGTNPLAATGGADGELVVRNLDALTFF